MATGWWYPNNVLQQKYTIISLKPSTVSLILYKQATLGERVESKINAAKCCQILQPAKELDLREDLFSRILLHDNSATQSPNYSSDFRTVT